MDGISFLFSVGLALMDSENDILKKDCFILSLTVFVCLLEKNGR